jgi:hypothetical protein
MTFEFGNMIARINSARFPSGFDGGSPAGRWACVQADIDTSKMNPTTVRNRIWSPERTARIRGVSG